jgi:hypothetical protein
MLADDPNLAKRVRLLRVRLCVYAIKQN